MATLLNQILQFIGNHTCVESGTSGIWSYRKYADGTYRCNTRVSGSVTTTGTVITNCYGYRREFTYPITFVSIPTVTHSDSVGTTYTINAGNIGETTTGFTALCFGVEASGTQTVRWNVEVTGKWK